MNDWIFYKEPEAIFGSLRIREMKEWWELVSGFVDMRDLIKSPIYHLSSSINARLQNKVSTPGSAYTYDFGFLNSLANDISGSSVAFTTLLFLRKL